MATTPLPRGVAISASLYRRLLLAYPRRFRRDYSASMAQVFRDCCRESYARRGLVGLVWLWLATLRDLARTAAVERIAEVVQMSRANWIKWGGVAAMAGGLLWSAQWLVGSGGAAPDVVFIMLVPLLLLAGLAGLGASAGRGWGWSGGVGFGLGALALGAMLIGAFGLSWTDSNPWWEMFVLGHLALFAGLVLVGLAAWRARPLARWNLLPLVMGALGFVCAVFVDAAYEQWGDRNVLLFIPIASVGSRSAMSCGPARGRKARRRR